LEEDSKTQEDKIWEYYKKFTKTGKDREARSRKYKVPSGQHVYPDYQKLEEETS
jgi:hypothetical protein